MKADRSVLNRRIKQGTSLSYRRIDRIVKSTKGKIEKKNASRIQRSNSNENRMAIVPFAEGRRNMQ